MSRWFGQKHFNMDYGCGGSKTFPLIFWLPFDYFVDFVAFLPAPGLVWVIFCFAPRLCHRCVCIRFLAFVYLFWIFSITQSLVFPSIGRTRESPASNKEGDAKHMPNATMTSFQAAMEVWLTAQSCFLLQQRMFARRLSLFRCECFQYLMCQTRRASELWLVPYRLGGQRSGCKGKVAHGSPLACSAGGTGFPESQKRWVWLSTSAAWRHAVAHTPDSRRD